MLKASPEVKVVIEGHTDATSSPEHNQALSQSRADAVQQYLTAAGINAARVTASGLGSTKPVATNDTPIGRAQNRRVECEAMTDVPSGPDQHRSHARAAGVRGDARLVSRLEEINALADRAPGFVWRLQTEEGNATYLRPYEDERIIVNMSCGSRRRR